MNTTFETNREIAVVLRELGDRLQHAGEPPFRVAAYWRAAGFLAGAEVEIADLFKQGGETALRTLPGIGKSLARTIAQLLRQGRCAKLERLRQRDEGEPLLRTVPGIGGTLAKRLRETLGSDSLEDVFAAACDGRLGRVPGFGHKRLRMVRECLANRLQRDTANAPHSSLPQPNVADLLSIDAEYLAKAAADRLPLAAPKLCNPTGARWLPILRTRRNGLAYVARFANSPKTHQLGHLRDWVVISCESKQHSGTWTVITAARGGLRGKRLVMYREGECREFYRNLRA